MSFDNELDLARRSNQASVFPLTGAHAAVLCVQCHVNSMYVALPTTCYGCHQADYTDTTNSPHAAAGYSTNCSLCHNTTSW